MLVERRSLKAGQMFVIPFGECQSCSGLNDVYVVIDRTREAGLWLGGTYAFGDVAPAWLVEVVS